MTKLQRAYLCTRKCVSCWKLAIASAAQLSPRTHLDSPFARAGPYVEDLARVLQGRKVVTTLEQDLENFIL